MKTPLKKRKKDLRKSQKTKIKIQMISYLKCWGRIYMKKKRVNNSKMRVKFMRMIMEETENQTGLDLLLGEELVELELMVLLLIKQTFQTTV